MTLDGSGARGEKRARRYDERSGSRAPGDAMAGVLRRDLHVSVFMCHGG